MFLANPKSKKPRGHLIRTQSTTKRAHKFQIDDQPNDLSSAQRIVSYRTHYRQNTINEEPWQACDSCLSALPPAQSYFGGASKPSIFSNSHVQSVFTTAYQEAMGFWSCHQHQQPSSPEMSRRNDTGVGSGPTNSKRKHGKFEGAPACTRIGTMNTIRQPLPINNLDILNPELKLVIVVVQVRCYLYCTVG